MADSRKTPMSIAHIAKGLAFFTNQEQKEHDKGFLKFSSSKKTSAPLYRHSKNWPKRAARSGGPPKSAQAEGCSGAARISDADSRAKHTSSKFLVLPGTSSNLAIITSFMFILRSPIRAEICS